MSVQEWFMQQATTTAKEVKTAGGDLFAFNRKLRRTVRDIDGHVPYPEKLALRSYAKQVFQAL